jgi:hypothetical protein
MSALGQKQTLHPEISMSALPPKADIRRQRAGGSLEWLFRSDKLRNDRLCP